MSGIHLTSGNCETLIVCALLTTLAAFFTVITSVVCGVTLTFHARPTLLYGIALALLFVPFAIGGSVWAYSVTRLASYLGIQDELVSSATFSRATALLLLCLAKTVPLGTFFCTTILQRYTSEIRPYCQTHQLRLLFFLFCGLKRIPGSILVLLGLFGGALMASESSLPIFLYRANPGTGPETANVLLARLFREIYASAGPDSLSRVAGLGVIISLGLLMAALLGTLAGKGILSGVRHFLQRASMVSRGGSKAVSSVLRIVMFATFAPGLLSLIVLLLPARLSGQAYGAAFGELLKYREIIVVGVCVAGALTMISVAIAVKLRYSQKDLLAVLESNSAAACFLILPAFIPVLSIIAVLGKISNGQITGTPGYIALFISHCALHYSIFQFICMTLIAAIPERHVAWQRAMKLRYSFSLWVDGFKRHIAVLVTLVGLGTVQVVTDGSISRWFSHLVKAPEETLYASVFGRLSSAAEAVIVAWSVGVVAMTVCTVLAAAYVRELRSHARYG